MTTSCSSALARFFDADYETFGIFGEPGEVLGNDFDDPRFFSPGAPRAGWIGIRVSF